MDYNLNTGNTKVNYFDPEKESQTTHERTLGFTVPEPEEYFGDQDEQDFTEPDKKQRDFEKTLNSEELKRYLNKQEALKQKLREKSKDLTNLKKTVERREEVIEDLQKVSLKPLLEEKKLWPLNEKQRKFVKLYVQSGGKKVESYMTAYKGVTRSAAHSLSTNLLKKENILAALDEEFLSVKSIARIDKVYVVGKIKDLVERSEASGNFKYLVEGLDMLAKIGGLYNSTPVQGAGIVNTGNMNIMFGDFEPSTGKVHPIQGSSLSAEDTDWTDIPEDESEDFTPEF